MLDVVKGRTLSFFCGAANDSCSQQRNCFFLLIRCSRFEFVYRFERLHTSTCLSLVSGTDIIDASGVVGHKRSASDDLIGLASIAGNDMTVGRVTSLRSLSIQLRHCDSTGVTSHHDLGGVIMKLRCCCQEIYS